METVLLNQYIVIANQMKMMTQLSKQQTTLDVMMSNNSNRETIQQLSKSSCLSTPFTAVKYCDELEVKLENVNIFKTL